MSALYQLPEDEFERALAELGRRAAFPSTPGLADEVVSLLRARSGSPVGSQTRRSRAYWAVAASVLIVAIGLSLAVSPKIRSALAGWLGVPGIKISHEDGSAGL